MKRSIGMAHSTMCSLNLTEIGRALSMYREEYHGWLPVNGEAAAVAPSGPYSTTTDPVSQVWFVQMYHAGFLEDLNVLVCPDDPYGFRMKQICGDVDSPLVAGCSSYGLNGFIMTAGKGALAHIDRFRIRGYQTILAGDLGPDSVFGPAATSPTTGGPKRDALLGLMNGVDPADGSGPWLTARHEKGINMLTVDGGVRPARTIDILKRKTPIRKVYREGELGGCTICTDLELYHYSFAKDQLYWWTGRAPVLVRSSP